MSDIAQVLVGRQETQSKSAFPINVVSRDEFDHCSNSSFIYSDSH